MKLIINSVIVFLIILLGYMLYNAISEPIKFQEEKSKRKRKTLRLSTSCTEP